MSKLLSCLKKKEGISFSSTRPRALDYTIKKVDVKSQKVKIQFSSGTDLALDFSTFNVIIEHLDENSDRFIRVGASLNRSNDEDTLEYQIQNHEKSARSHTKRAPHICDLLQLCGFVTYGKALNPRTSRVCQAVKWNVNP